MGVLSHLTKGFLASFVTLFFRKVSECLSPRSCLFLRGLFYSFKIFMALANGVFCYFIPLVIASIEENYLLFSWLISYTITFMVSVLLV